MADVSAHPTTPAAPAVSADEAVEEALASARLEGLKPSPEALDDFRRAAEGEIDGDELVERTLARYRP